MILHLKYYNLLNTNTPRSYAIVAELIQLAQTRAFLHRTRTKFGFYSEQQMKVDALQAQKETLLNQLHSLEKLLNKVSKGKQDRLSYAQNKNVSPLFPTIVNLILHSHLVTKFCTFLGDLPCVCIGGVKEEDYWG